MQVKYIGKTNKYLVNGHIYEIIIEKHIKYYSYDLTVLSDLTDDCDIGYLACYASQNGIKRDWDIKDIVLGD